MPLCESIVVARYAPVDVVGDDDDDDDNNNNNNNNNDGDDVDGAAPVASNNTTTNLTSVVSNEIVDGKAENIYLPYRNDIYIETC
jgi:hypothetical protein